MLFCKRCDNIGLIIGSIVGFFVIVVLVCMVFVLANVVLILMAIVLIKNMDIIQPIKIGEEVSEWGNNDVGGGSTSFSGLLVENSEPFVLIIILLNNSYVK